MLQKKKELKRRLASLLIVAMAAAMVPFGGFSTMADEPGGQATPSEALLPEQSLTTKQLTVAAEAAVTHGDYFDFMQFAEILSEEAPEEYQRMLDSCYVFQLFKEKEEGRFTASSSQLIKPYMYSLLLVPQEDYEMYIEEAGEEISYPEHDWAFAEDEAEEDFPWEEDEEDLPAYGPALESEDPGVGTEEGQDPQEGLYAASPSEASESDHGYRLTGREEFLFFYVNETSKEVTFRVNVDGLALPAMSVPSYQMLEKETEAVEETETVEETEMVPEEKETETDSQTPSEEEKEESENKGESGEKTESEDTEESGEESETEVSEESGEESESEASEESGEESESEEPKETEEESESEETEETEEEAEPEGTEEKTESEEKAESGEKTESEKKVDSEAKEESEEKNEPEVSISAARLGEYRLMAAAEPEFVTGATQSDAEQTAESDADTGNADRTEESDADAGDAAQTEESDADTGGTEQAEESDSAVPMTVFPPVCMKPAAGVSRFRLFSEEPENTIPQLTRKAAVGGISVSAAVFLLEAEAKERSEFPYAFDDSILEKSMPEMNQWQIVSGGYQNPESGVSYSGDGAVRFQKNVISTDTENEFKMYLNVEPQVSWNEIMQFNTILVGESNSIKDGYPANRKSELLPERTATHTKEMFVRYYRLEGTEKIYLTDVLSMWACSGKVPNGSYGVGNQAIMDGASFGSKSRVAWDKNTYDNPEDINITELFRQGYDFASDVVKITDLTDQMGKFILCEGLMQSTSPETVYFDGDSPDSVNSDGESLTWHLPEQDLDEIEYDSDYHLLGLREEMIGTQKTYYRKNAYQLIYNFALTVEAEGFLSSADVDHEYHTNQMVTIDYEVGGVSQPSYQERKSPTVKGLLYNIEFSKHYGDSPEQRPLPGVTFRAERRDTVEDNRQDYPDGFETEELYWFQAGYAAEAVSQEDGSVQFTGLPFGKYEITEVSLDEGDTGYFADLPICLTAVSGPVELCYTNGKTTTADDCTTHDADNTEEAVNAPNMLARFADVWNQPNQATLTVTKVVDHPECVPEKLLRETEFLITAKDGANAGDPAKVKAWEDRTPLNETWELAHDTVSETISLLVPEEGGQIRVSEALSGKEFEKFRLDRIAVEGENGETECDGTIEAKPGDDIRVIVHNRYINHSIHLEKQVSTEEPQTVRPLEYTFEIQFDGALSPADLQVKKTSGGNTSAYPVTDLNFKENVLTVLLKKGESVDVEDLPLSVTGYSITEKLDGFDSENYKVELETIEVSSTADMDGAKIELPGMSNSFAQSQAQRDSVIFTNRFLFEGYLQIHKKLISSVTDSEEAPASENVTFAFELTAEDGEKFYAAIEIPKGKSSGTTDVLKVPTGKYTIRELPNLRYQAVSEEIRVAVEAEHTITAPCQVEFYNYKTGEEFFYDSARAVNLVGENGFQLWEKSWMRR